MAWEVFSVLRGLDGGGGGGGAVLGLSGLLGGGVGALWLIELIPRRRRNMPTDLLFTPRAFAASAGVAPLAMAWRNRLSSS